MENNKLLDRQARQIEKQLAKEYTRVAKDTVSEIRKLYLEMGDNPSYQQLMRMDRYQKLLGNLNQKLKKMGKNQITLIGNGMKSLYCQVDPLVSDLIAEEAIKRIWCQDGKLYSDRVWSNMKTLQSTLQTGIMDCVVAGRSHQVLEREVRHRFGVSQSDSSRLVRTELNYIQNQAQVRAYLDAGYEYYQFITAKDNRTCDECGKLNGQIFRLAEAEVGVNLPPLHPNCRSNIIGYKED